MSMMIRMNLKKLMRGSFLRLWLLEDLFNAAKAWVSRESLGFSIFINILRESLSLCMVPNTHFIIANISGLECFPRLLGTPLICLECIPVALEMRTIRKIVLECSLRENMVLSSAIVLNARNKPILIRTVTSSISMSLI